MKNKASPPEEEESNGPGVEINVDDLKLELEECVESLGQGWFQPACHKESYC